MRRLLIALFSVLLASTALIAAPVAASPTTVAATAGGVGILDVTWTASPDGALVDYKVQADQGGGEVTSVIVAAPATSAQLTGLGNGETYTVIVTARDIAQASLGADSVIASTDPIAPSGASISLGTVTSSSMVATFSADDGGGTNSYTLVVETPTAGGALVQTIPGATSPASINGLDPSTTYSVTVTADNGVAPPATAAASETTGGPPVVDPVVTSVTATANGATTVDVTWAATAGGGTNAYTTSISPDEGTGGVTASADTSTSYTGLTAGTTYTVTVTATNESGSDDGSDDATTVGLTNITGVTATASSSTNVDVLWSIDNGGGNNTYSISVLPADAATQTGVTGLLTTFTGLNPSTAYTFTVTPTNEAGTGTTGSDTATTDDPPVVAPSGATISLGSVTANSMVATFSADAGGGTNSYTLVVRTPNAAGTVVQTIPAATSPATISSLDPNTAYSVTVSADNGVAPAATAEASATTSAGQASAPQSVSAALAGPFDNFVRVSFNAPADLAGGTVANYTVNLSNGQTLIVASSPATFETVAAGTSVTATVTANTQAGPGATSAPSNSVTTSDVPGPVTGLTAEWAGEANINAINVDWTAPADNGGLAITGYVVEVSPALENPIPVVDPGETAVTVGGLEQGESYTITVRAQNDRGNSAGTSSSPVLVPTTPGTVTNLVVQQSPPFSPGIVLTWDLPEDDGGSPITGYRVSVDDQATDVGPDITTVSFASLPVGDHNVTVQALTAAGLGAAVTSPNFEVKAFPPFDTEEDFVTQLYTDFLRRAPDAGGLAFWTARVADDGSNVQEIVEAFMRSPEFSPRRGVARLYFAYFNRQPDKGGFDFWTRQISSGAGTLESASQDFAASPEFQATYGSLTDAEFVVLVYNNVLARRPDTDGFRFWLAELTAGMSRGRLMTLFSESPENISLSRAAVDVTVTYDGMLQREADAGGFAFWRDQIAGSTNALPTLIRQFYFSPEYAERVTR